MNYFQIITTLKNYLVVNEVKLAGTQVLKFVECFFFVGEASILMGRTGIKIPQIFYEVGNFGNGKSELLTPLLQESSRMVT